MRIIDTIVLTFAVSPVLFGQATNQNPADSGELRAKQVAETMLRMDRGWGDKLSAAGAILRLQETSRTNGRTIYRLHAEGLPADHVYSLVQWPVTQQQPSVALQGVTISDSGVAICAGRTGTCGDANKPNDPIDLATAPAQGEPLRFALIAQDAQGVRAAVKLVPNPYRGVDKSCRVDAELLTPHAELISVVADGFAANEEITFSQNSEGEIHTDRKRTDGTGRVDWGLMPFKAGLKSGSVTISVKAEGCNPQVSVPWEYIRLPACA